MAHPQAVVFFGLLGTSAAGSWQAERLLFVRERVARYYGTGCYFMSKVLCDVLLLRLVPTAVFALITHALVQYAAARRRTEEAPRRVAPNGGQSRRRFAPNGGPKQAASL